jgi:hypothetical protein
VTWVKLDDRFPDHPKVGDLSDAAFRAYVSGLCYSAEHLTDGFLPPAFISRSKPRTIAELVEAGLWEHGNGSRGVHIHDYLEFQPSRSETEANREARASAGRRGGRSSGEARRKQGAST